MELPVRVQIPIGTQKYVFLNSFCLAIKVGIARMYIKILYFDSSAILSYFLKDDGNIVVGEILNNAGAQAFSLNLSHIAKVEINKKEGLPTYHSRILKDFRIVNGSEEERKNYLQHLINKYPVLLKKKNSQDLAILSELYYLKFFVGPSHPILISCDNLMNEIGLQEGYRVFNPRKKTIDDLINY